MNLLLYDNALPNLPLILNSLNSSTTTNIGQFNSDITGENRRLGLMYTNRNYSKVPFMLSGSSFNKYNFFTDRLINFIITNNIKVVDIISCNMNTNSFTSECKKIYADHNIIINYSVNKTGNISGGDWIMEATNQPISSGNEYVPDNVRTIYFTDNILNWEFDLDVPNNDLLTLLGNNVQIIPIAGGSTKYKLLHNVTLDYTGSDHYMQLESGDIFDGNHKRIEIINNYTAGLFTSNAISSNYCTVKDLTLRCNLGSIGGGIITSSQEYFKIINCNYHGKLLSIDLPCSNNNFIVNVANSGGICGWACSYFTIIKCRNYADIYNSCGGICGSSCQQFIIKKCKNYGTIFGEGAGGIVGSGILAYDTSILQNNIVENCLNKGDIIGLGAGGICGSFCGMNYNGNNTSIDDPQFIVTTTINECINLGKVKGNLAGGICGDSCGYCIVLFDFSTNYNNVSNVNIINCKNYGDIFLEGGGICGGGCSSIGAYYYPLINSESNVIISRCHNYGNVLQSGGGILGRFALSPMINNTTTIVVDSCHIYGNIYNYSGAVCGPDSYNSPVNIDINGIGILTISNNIIKSKCHKHSAIFLGNNCTAFNNTNPSIIITHNKYNHKYKKYENLVSGTIVSYS